MCLYRFFSLTGIWVICACSLNAQTPQGHDKNQNHHIITINIPEISLVAIRSSTGTSIVLEPSVPLEAGSDFSHMIANDSSLWLNYSHVRSGSSHPYRHIYVRLSSGTVPSGFRLSITPSASTGPTGVPQGEPLGETNVGATDVKLIKDITTSYTGMGSGYGHQLVYTLTPIVGETRLMDFNQNAVVEVIYTIAD